MHVQELSKVVSDLSTKHTISTSVRLVRAATQHSQLTSRLLKLISHLHLLVTPPRGRSIRPEEEALKVALEDVEFQLNHSHANSAASSSSALSKINEMWALISIIKSRRERERREGGGGNQGWAVVDEGGVREVQKVLVSAT